MYVEPFEINLTSTNFDKYKKFFKDLKEVEVEELLVKRIVLLNEKPIKFSYEKNIQNDNIIETISYEDLILSKIGNFDNYNNNRKYYQNTFTVKLKEYENVFLIKSNIGKLILTNLFSAKRSKQNNEDYDKFIQTLKKALK